MNADTAKKAREAKLRYTPDFRTTVAEAILNKGPGEREQAIAERFGVPVTTAVNWADKYTLGKMPRIVTGSRDRARRLAQPLAHPPTGDACRDCTALRAEVARLRDVVAKLVL